MDLKDFITETLSQIAKGVGNAQNEYQQLGGVVNPSGLQQIVGDIPYGKATALHGSAILLCNVQFEVSLTNDTKNNSSGGIGVLFGAVSIGGKTGNENSQISLTKVKFNIPVKLPSR